MSIFLNIKRLFKHSSIYGIGHIFGRSINFLLLPFYTNIFPRDNYGVVGLLFTYIAILMVVYTYGLDAAFFRFFIIENDKQRRRIIFSTAFYTLLTTSLIFSTFIFLFPDFIVLQVFSKTVQQLEIPLSLMIRLVSGILFFDTLAFLPFLMLRAQERSTMFIVFKFINIFINIAFNIIFLGFLGYGIEGIFMANFIASLITFIFLLPIIIKGVDFIFSRVTMKDLIYFGLPYSPVTLAIVVMDTIDRPLLEKLADIEAVGLYNAGVKLGMFMAIFVTAFRFAWNPFFLSVSKQANAKETFSKVLTYLLTLCSMVFLILSFFIDNIARIEIFGFTLIGKAYWEGTIVVPLILLAYILYAVYLNFLIGIYLEKKTKYLPIITLVGMLSNMAANCLLIPWIGLVGAATARLIGYCVMAIFLYQVAKRFYRIQYEWNKIMKLALIVGGFFILGKIPIIESYGLMKCGLLFLFPLLLISFNIIERYEINRLKTVFKTHPF